MIIRTPELVVEKNILISTRKPNKKQNKCEKCYNHPSFHNEWIWFLNYSIYIILN